MSIKQCWLRAVPVYVSNLEEVLWDSSVKKCAMMQGLQAALQSLMLCNADSINTVQYQHLYQVWSHAEQTVLSKTLGRSKLGLVLLALCCNFHTEPRCLLVNSTGALREGIRNSPACSFVDVEPTCEDYAVSLQA